MRRQNKTYIEVMQQAPPIPLHLTDIDLQDIKTITGLYNCAIDLYFKNLQLAQDAEKTGEITKVVEFSTKAAMASYEAKRLDGLRVAVLHQANYFKTQ